MGQCVDEEVPEEAWEGSLQACGSINDGFNAPLPCRVKIDAGNGRKDIEAFRLAPKTKEAVPVGEIFRGDAFERCAKFGERRLCQ